MEIAPACSEGAADESAADSWAQLATQRPPRKAAAAAVLAEAKKNLGPIMNEVAATQAPPPPPQAQAPAKASIAKASAPFAAESKEATRASSAPAAAAPAVVAPAEEDAKGSPVRVTSTKTDATSPSELKETQPVPPAAAMAAAAAGDAQPTRLMWRSTPVKGEAAATGALAQI
jgi:ribonuclease E